MDEGDAWAENAPLLLGSLAALGLGMWCMLDDWKDFEKWPENPADRENGVPHHGLLGVLLILGGLAGVGVSLMRIAAQTAPLKQVSGEYAEDEEVSRVRRLPRPLYLPERELAKYA